MTKLDREKEVICQGGRKGGTQGKRNMWTRSVAFQGDRPSEKFGGGKGEGGGREDKGSHSK